MTGNITREPEEPFINDNWLKAIETGVAMVIVASIATNIARTIADLYFSWARFCSADKMGVAVFIATSILQMKKPPR